MQCTRCGETAFNLALFFSQTLTLRLKISQYFLLMEKNSWQFRTLICLEHWEMISVYLSVCACEYSICWFQSTAMILYWVYCSWCVIKALFTSLTHCHGLNDLCCLEGEHNEFPIDMFQQGVNDCLTALNNIWGWFLTTLQNGFSLHWAVLCISPKLDISWNLQKLKWELWHEFSIFCVKSMLY